MKGKKISLFAKYFIMIALTAIISLVVLGSAFTAFLLNYWIGNTQNSMLSNLTGFIDASASVEYPEEFKDEDSAFYSMIDIFRETSDTDVYIADLNGHIIVESMRKDAGNKNRSDIPSDVVAGLNFSSPTQDYTSMGKWHGRYNGKVIFVAKPVFKGTQLFAVMLSVKPLSDFFNFYNKIFRPFLFSALFALILSVGIAYYLVYRMYKPIKQLSRATRKIASGDYSYRVDIDENDEFAELGEAFNDMAKDLSTLESSRRQFIANISHELKTPMTTIGGFIDGIMDGTIPPDRQQHYLGIVSSEVKRLSRLVIAMLNLSKIEAGELKLEKKQVDVSKMVFEILLSFEQIIQKNAIEVLGLENLKSIIVSADRDMLYQVFYNLIDNAVKFTDKGGYLAVNLEENDNKFVFRIRNKCEGISSEDLNNIFDRFYKVDKSRSADGKGFGLGLYIAKSIVEMHGGQITAISRTGENCEFLFWIPIE